MSALYLRPLTISRRVGTCPSRKFSVTSYTADTDTERDGDKGQNVPEHIAWIIDEECLPVSLRQWTVVVKPLVLGSRWYFSLGRPLLEYEDRVRMIPMIL